ncbi:MFS transporter [Fodinicurvata sp. EGI_FJ10296]|uniref:MFS transporter n=1 Tax=Fodinicurvata sp. EGI_FJ10296 TaxID=3231908 RepID=UPI003453905E
MAVNRTTNAAPRLSGRVLAAYGAPALPLAALGLPVFIHLPTFYATTMGLGLTAVGAILLFARLWDVITDPLIGFLSDRTTGRFGRRRPWIVAGTPLVLTATWFLFVPPDGAGGWHLLVWSLVLYLGWTMMILPLSAWGAELSPDYHERSRISAWREGFLVVGTMLALALPVAFGYVDAQDAGGALTVIAVMIVVLLPASVILLLAVTPDSRFRSTAGAAGFLPGLKVLRRNAGFRRLIAAYLINGIANGLPATLFLLFVTHRLEIPGQAGSLLAMYFFCGILAVPMWLKLSYRYGKHTVWCAAMVWACIWFAMVPFLGPGDFWAFLAICILTGIPLGADLVLPASMQADVIDADTIETGERRAGLFFALWGMATKLALALAVGMAFPILNLAGFSEDGGNGAPALITLVVLYSLLPVIFKVGAIVLMAGFPITAERQYEMRRRLEERDNDESEAAAP